MIKLPNFKNLAKVVTSFAKVHSPELLIGLGIGGMITSTVLAVKATPKAVEKIKNTIDEKNEELMDIAVAAHRNEYQPIIKLKPTEVIKLCWKDYASAAITGTASVICIIGGTHINLKRNAALVTAVKLSEMTIKDLQAYKNKVTEVIGQEKSDEIEEKVNDDAVTAASINLDSALVSGNGPILCYDKIGGQFFKSDKESIRSAINSLNSDLNDEIYVSLNDLYDKLNMTHTIAGDQLGWNRDHGLIEPRFSSHLLPNGVPVLVLSTRLEPRVDYTRLM